MYHEEFYLFLKALNESCKIVLFDFIFLPFKFIKLICSFCNEKSDLKEIDGLYKLNKSMCFVNFEIFINISFCYFLALIRTTDLLNEMTKKT